MIIGEKFVWLHFPKCAGSTVHEIFRLNNFPDIQIDIDNVQIDPSVKWHDNIKQREKRECISLAGKDVIMNCRRLPEWILSRIFFEEKRSPQFKHNKENFLNGSFYEANGKINTADTYLKKYRWKSIKKWIRVEAFESDFIDIFSQYIGGQINHLNVSVNKNIYNKNILEYYNEHDMGQLYCRNPEWKEMELRNYGNLLIDLCFT